MGTVARELWVLSWKCFDGGLSAIPICYSICTIGASGRIGILEIGERGLGVGEADPPNPSDKCNE